MSNIEDMASEKDFFYVLRLQIEHPYFDEKFISKEIELNANYCFQYKKNGDSICRWNFSSWTKNEKHFFIEANDFLHWLERKKNFFLHIAQTGGCTKIIASLPGKINMSDILLKETLELSLKLKIKIGVEVYPRLYAK